MKKNYSLFIVCILLTSSIASFAQNYTSIPDANFEQALISLGHDSGTIDGKVLTDNIKDITFLNVKGKNIKSLTGIEDFTALTRLYCEGNPLEELNLTKNTDLKELWCYNNQRLTELNLTKNTDLKELICSNNQIKELNLTKNTALTKLGCSDNLIRELNLTKNTALKELWCADNLLTELNLTKNTALTILDCGGNRLTELNLTKNSELTHLDCATNPQLTELNLTKNTDLKELICSYNRLTELNLKNGNNTKFTSIRAQNNPNLSCIEVDDAAYSTTNWVGRNFSFDANVQFKVMTAIPDANFEQALISLGHDSGTIDGKVPTDNIKNITYLDVHGKNIQNLAGIEDFKALEILFCNGNQLEALTFTNNNALKKLSCGGNRQLTELNLANNSELTHLDCGGNQLSSLNLTNNSKLTELICADNQLAVLDLTNNTALTKLICSGNLITTLNLSKNTALKELYCVNNRLTNLNLKNDNNKKLTVIKANNNANLSCIEVDDVAYSDSKWRSGDFVFGTNAQFKTSCEAMTDIPDANFEQALIDLNIDSGPIDGKVPTNNIKNIISLDVHGKNIQSLTGIEDFTALTNLDCGSNQLTALNLTKNTDLKELWCYGNQLTALDLKNNKALTKLICNGNQLTALNLTNNTDLKELWCHENQLTALDLKNNKALTKLLCLNNRLTALNLTKNTALTILYCATNQLTALNLTNNSELTELYCYNNRLTNLNLKNDNNKKLTVIKANNNANLSCIEVDDVAYSNSTWVGRNFVFDTNAQFKTSCGTLATNDFSKDAKLLYYPSPVRNTLTLKVTEPIEYLAIYNIIGQKIATKTPKSKHVEINMHTYKSGTYFIKIKSNNTTKTITVIKE